MDYLKALRDDPDLAEEFDSLFDFFLLDDLSPRDEADGRATFTLPGMAFARDGSGGEYHLLEDGSIGYYSSDVQGKARVQRLKFSCKFRKKSPSRKRDGDLYLSLIHI